MSSLSDSARRSELHGISGPSQSNRTGKRDREYDEVPKNSWKKKPTMIQTPTQGGVSNPYDRRAQTRNPTARAVVAASHLSNGLRPPPPKRQKFATDVHNNVAKSSRYFTEQASTSMSTHNGFGPSIDALSSSTSTNRRTGGLPALKERNTTFDIFSPKSPISILDDNEDEDIGIPMERKSSGDELDVINLASANSSMSIADDLGVSISKNEHPFERQSPPRASSSRPFIMDGPSTQRLRKQVESRGSRLRSPKASASSRIGSPASPETVDIDEIEDFEGNNDSTRGAIHRPPLFGATPLATKRATSPKGITNFPPNNVQTKRQMFETKPTAPEVNLKSIQPKKGLTAGMKPRLPLKIEQKDKDRQLSQNAWTGSRKDKVATSSTSYSGGTDLLALPLEVCVWGTRIFEIDPKTAVDPEHWLLWNKESNELQLVEHPLILNLRSKHSVVESVNFEKLQKCNLEISQEDANPFIAVQFRDNVRGIQDEVLHIGLAFKFQSSHTNTRTSVASLRDELVKLSDSRPHSLLGSAVFKCLDMYREQAGSRLNNDTLSSRDMEAVKARISKGLYAAPLTEETTSIGKPRPAYGKNAAVLPMEPRRRSARLAPESPQRSNPSNLDEVILVYPQSGPGALNITNSDMKRLEPSEFLNDTLIELGLKFLMNDIREKNPDLANEIHIFSTFFYKKLNHKNFKEGYSSVRKWTAKVDLFKKKYIIVPINENIHWYLAIIYRPEYILDENPPKPSSRTSRRTSNVDVSGSNVDDDKGTGRDCSLESMDTTQLSDRSQSPATMRDDDETVVDHVVESTRLCSINDERHDPRHSRSDSPELGNDFNESPNNGLGTVEGGGRSASLNSDASPSNSEDEEVDQLLGDDDDFKYPMPGEVSPPLVSGRPSSDVVSKQADIQNDPMDVDSPVTHNTLLKDSEMHPGEAELSNNSLPGVDGGDNSTIGTNDDSAAGGPGSQENGNVVPTTSFSQYTTAAARGTLSSELIQVEDLKSCLSGADLAVVEAGESEEEKEKEKGTTENDIQNERQTWIFTFDSLGSGHDKARKLLDRYLRAEAQDKMHTEHPSVAKGKTAVVPTQPNYCDCGLYLLHFTRTFLSDPDGFKHIICTSKKTQEASRRAKVWQGDQVATMRREMLERIRKESEIFKKVKAEKESQLKEASGDSAKQASAVESSDDEIIVGEISRRHASPVKRGKKAREAATVSSDRTVAPASKEKKATRLRG